jgi:hypothetical protein
MKLSLDALRTRQRLRIRVPASPLSFVNALQTGSFLTWVHFRKVRRQPLLPIREGLPVIQEPSGSLPASRLIVNCYHQEDPNFKYHGSMKRG